jgi:creatinine amidohydrolase
MPGEAPTLRVRLAELASAEVRERLARGPVLLLPMGSLEEQGPHAPMGDFLLADRLATLMAERAAFAGIEALVLPPIPFGGADWFGSVPGGVSLRQTTLAALLEDVLSCLARHGSDRVLIVNGHSGNATTIDLVTRGIALAGRRLAPCLHLWRSLAARWEALGGDRATLGHGADPLWSVALALFPELCRPDLMRGPEPPPPVLGLPVTGFGTLDAFGLDVTVPIELDRIAPSGVVGGDPARGSAELGARAVAWIVEAGARLIAHLAAQR